MCLSSTHSNTTHHIRLADVGVPERVWPIALYGVLCCGVGCVKDKHIALLALLPD